MEEKILIADKDRNFIKSMEYVLKKSHYSINTVDSVEDLNNKIETRQCDLLVLSTNIGNGDLKVCKNIRTFSDIPIIIVSDVEDEFKKIFALENGVDDYLTKPVNPQEVRARIKNILRRCKVKKVEDPRAIVRGNFIIDILKKRIYTKCGRDLNLTSKEFELLYLLSSEPGRVFTRDELMLRIWEYENFGTSRTVDVHIRKLRCKLEKNLGQDYIETKWGEGYYFKLE